MKDWNGKRYHSLNYFLRNKYGEKIYKIPLDGGFTCPNRDGKVAKGGCTFCSSHGSGDFAGSRILTITEQFDDRKKMMEKKWNKGKYIAYFQAFTNTYAPVERLRELYTEAISQPDIAALSIGTRPDCLGENVLALLDEMNKRVPVFVELGLQTIHEDTARYIRRGYDLSVYDKAVADLHKIGVNVVTHLIIGLPGESKEDMLRSVEYVCKMTDGIKLQLLHILRGTDLETEYNSGKIKELTLEEYTDIIRDCVKIIPKSVVVHRLTGDGAKKDLIAPMWSADKKNVLNTINRALQE